MLLGIQTPDGHQGPIISRVLEFMHLHVQTNSKMSEFTILQVNTIRRLSMSNNAGAKISVCPGIMMARLSEC